MYKYTISSSNPECTDWECDFRHEKKFTDVEFYKIADGAFIAYFKDAIEKKTFLPTCGSAHEFIPKHMEKLGFEHYWEQPQERYDIEPYCGTNHSKDLQAFIKEARDRAHKREKE